MKLSRDLQRLIATKAGVDLPAKRRSPPVVETGAAVYWQIALTVPCRVVSEANSRVHWSARSRRFNRQASALTLAIRSAWFLPEMGTWELPKLVAVTWTHVGPRMDDDNLAGAFKGLRDKLAGILGVDDGDDRILWHYAQRTGQPGVELTLTNRGKE